MDQSPTEKLNLTELRLDIAIVIIGALMLLMVTGLSFTILYAGWDDGLVLEAMIPCAATINITGLYLGFVEYAYGYALPETWSKAEWFARVGGFSIITILGLGCLTVWSTWIERPLWGRANISIMVVCLVIILTVTFCVFSDVLAWHRVAGFPNPKLKFRDYVRSLSPEEDEDEELDSDGDELS